MKLKIDETEQELKQSALDSRTKPIDVLISISIFLLFKIV
jgi:hypothetical protein